MSQAIAPSEVTLRPQAAPDQQFFSEWQQNTPPLSDLEQQSLDRVKLNFLDLLEDPPVLENSVKLVILAPLLDLAGFYRRPFRITTETSTNLELVDAGITIRGRIDVLVVNGLLWLVVIESKRSDFAVVRALPQTLAYLLANPNPPQPTFGLITNGTEYLFLKASHTPSPQYATSRLFSLFNPGNELYPVLAILKQITPGRSL